MDNQSNPTNVGTTKETKKISKTELTTLRNEKFYTVEQVATYYGITNHQATRAIKAAGLSTRLVGRQRNSFELVD